MVYKTLEAFPRGKKCLLCSTSLADPEKLGEIYQCAGVIIHYFCLLLASKVEQNGEDDKGILGFYPRDIKKEAKRGTRVVCSYCKQNGACIFCAKEGCSIAFHLPCGLDNDSFHHFFDSFESFCKNHGEKQVVPTKLKKQVRDCVICSHPIIFSREKYIWPPCCKPKALLHKTCTQRLASSAGYYMKCPLCNNKTDFCSGLRTLGIFIPEREASWEVEPHAFQELSQLTKECEAVVCKCPQGRTHCTLRSKNKKWNIEPCKLCGSVGIHYGCMEQPIIPGTFECSTCVGVSQRFANNEPGERDSERAEAVTPPANSEAMTEDNSSNQESSSNESSDSEEFKEFCRARRRNREELSSNVIVISSESEDEVSYDRSCLMPTPIKKPICVRRSPQKRRTLQAVVKPDKPHCSSTAVVSSVEENRTEAEAAGFPEVPQIFSVVSLTSEEGRKSSESFELVDLYGNQHSFEFIDVQNFGQGEAEAVDSEEPTSRILPESSPLLQVNNVYNLSDAGFTLSQGNGDTCPQEEHDIFTISDTDSVRSPESIIDISSLIQSQLPLSEHFSKLAFAVAQQQSNQTSKTKPKGKRKKKRTSFNLKKRKTVIKDLSTNGVISTIIRQLPNIESNDTSNSSLITDKQPIENQSSSPSRKGRLDKKNLKLHSSVLTNTHQKPISAKESSSMNVINDIPLPSTKRGSRSTTAKEAKHSMSALPRHTRQTSAFYSESMSVEQVEIDECNMKDAITSIRNVTIQESGSHSGKKSVEQVRMDECSKKDAITSIRSDTKHKSGSRSGKKSVEQAKMDEYSKKDAITSTLNDTIQESGSHFGKKSVEQVRMDECSKKDAITLIRSETMQDSGSHSRKKSVDQVRMYECSKTDVMTSIRSKTMYESGSRSRKKPVEQVRMDEYSKKDVRTTIRNDTKQESGSHSRKKSVEQERMDECSKKDFMTTIQSDTMLESGFHVNRQSIEQVGTDEHRENELKATLPSDTRHVPVPHRGRKFMQQVRMDKCRGKGVMKYGKQDLTRKKEQVLCVKETVVEASLDSEKARTRTFPSNQLQDGVKALEIREKKEISYKTAATESSNSYLNESNEKIIFSNNVIVNRVNSTVIDNSQLPLKKSEIMNCNDKAKSPLPNIKECSLVLEKVVFNESSCSKQVLDKRNNLKKFRSPERINFSNRDSSLLNQDETSRRGYFSANLFIKKPLNSNANELKLPHLGQYDDVLISKNINTVLDIINDQEHHALYVTAEAKNSTAHVENHVEERCGPDSAKNKSLEVAERKIQKLSHSKENKIRHRSENSFKLSVAGDESLPAGKVKSDKVLNKRKSVSSPVEVTKKRKWSKVASEKKGDMGNVVTVKKTDKPVETKVSLSTHLLITDDSFTEDCALESESCSSSIPFSPSQNDFTHKAFLPCSFLSAETSAEISDKFFNLESSSAVERKSDGIAPLAEKERSSIEKAEETNKNITHSKHLVDGNICVAIEDNPLDCGTSSIEASHSFPECEISNSEVSPALPECRISSSKTSRAVSVCRSNCSEKSDAFSGCQTNSREISDAFPECGTSSSEASTALPECRIGCGEVSDVFVECRTNSSEASTALPGCGTSSIEASTAPPECGTSSSEASTILPECGTSSSEVSTILPECGTSNSEASTTLPGCGTSASEVATALPECGTSNIEASTALPECGISSIEASTTLPECATSNNEASTALSGCGSSSSEASTALAECGTSSSEASTALPECGISSIEASTSLPDCGSSNSEASTALPEYGTSSSEASPALTECRVGSGEASDAIAECQISSSGVSHALPKCRISDASNAIPECRTSGSETSLTFPESQTSSNGTSDTFPGCQSSICGVSLAISNFRVNSSAISECEPLVDCGERGLSSSNVSWYKRCLTACPTCENSTLFLSERLEDSLKESQLLMNTPLPDQLPERNDSEVTSTHTHEALETNGICKVSLQKELALEVESNRTGSFERFDCIEKGQLCKKKIELSFSSNLKDGRPDGCAGKPGIGCSQGLLDVDSSPNGPKSPNNGIDSVKMNNESLKMLEFEANLENILPHSSSPLVLSSVDSPNVRMDISNLNNTNGKRHSDSVPFGQELIQVLTKTTHNPHNLNIMNVHEVSQNQKLTCEIQYTKQKDTSLYRETFRSEVLVSENASYISSSEVTSTKSDDNCDCSGFEILHEGSVNENGSTDISLVSSTVLVESRANNKSNSPRSERDEQGSDSSVSCISPKKIMPNWYLPGVITVHVCYEPGEDGRTNHRESSSQKTLLPMVKVLKPENSLFLRSYFLDAFLFMKPRAVKIFTDRHGFKYSKLFVENIPSFIRTTEVFQSDSDLATYLLSLLHDQDIPNLTDPLLILITSTCTNLTLKTNVFDLLKSVTSIRNIFLVVTTLLCSNSAIRQFNNKLCDFSRIYNYQVWDINKIAFKFPDV